MMKNTVREANVAGTFYDSSPEELKNRIKRFLSNIPSPQPTSLHSLGFIAPHAGVIYSGQTAAYVYKIIESLKPENIIIIGPSHFSYFNGISIDKSTHYKTPLGLAEINTEISSLIAGKSSCAVYEPESHEKEHSLEVQIPFIQVASPDTRIIPIVIGNVIDSNITETAGILADILRTKPGTIIIASSDMSHFHPYNVAVEMDKRAIDSIVELDIKKLLVDYTSKKIEMCGFIPALIMMLAMENLGYNNVIPLKYTNSGDITKDTSSVVGYSSICFAKTIYSQEELSTEEKKYLLALARNTIREKLELPLEKLPIMNSELLGQKRGAFVTLHKDNRLRGCIGYIQPVKSILETIKEMALSAAFNDQRFEPLEAEEEPAIDIEISILSPIEEVKNIEDITIGRHGLIIKQGQHSGLLLPQVAPEWNWNRTEFLQQTCLKAGLAPDAWQKGAQIFSFTANIFNENM